jgi:predicted O-methyltransferase YrrM
MLHNSSCQALLDEIDGHGQSHDASAGCHEEKLLNLDRRTAGLVSLLVEMRAPRSVLEIGTSNGFSTIWIALALQRTRKEFRFITVERSEIRAEEASRNFKRANIAHAARCLVGEAIDIIGTIEGEIDCVFFDGDRKTTHKQFDLVFPKLSKSCLLMADNAVSHERELFAYVDRIQNEPDFRAVTVPIGKGLHIAIRT